MPRILLIALALTLMLQSCAGRGSQLQSAANPSPPSFSLPLPVDAPREAGMRVYLSVSGDNPHAYSGDPLIGDGTLEMAAAAGDLQYAIYRLSTAGHPLETIEVNLSTMAGEGCWLAIADYAQGTWDISGPHSSGTLVNSEPEQDWVSPGNYFYIAVLAHDNTTVSVSRVLAAVDMPAWQKHVIEGPDSCGRYSSLANLNGRPAVSYHSYTQWVLRFALANSAAPSLTADWSIHTPDDGGGGVDHVGNQSSLGVFDGKPLIAYASTSLSALKIATTLEAEPDAAEDWQTYELEPLSIQNTGCISLASVGGLPALAFGEREPGWGMSYAYASQAVPALEDWQVTPAYAPADEFQRLRLVELGGHPAISMQLGFTDTSLVFVQSGTAAPLTPADWAAHTVDSGDNAGYGCDMLVLDGRPAIGYLKPDADLVLLAHAQTATPASSIDWDTSTVDGSAGAEAHVGMALVAGRPCLAYWDAGSEAVWCAWAKITAPAVPSDWAFTLVDWGLGTSGGQVSVADIGGLPAITYYDSENSDLKYARQVTP